MEDYLNSYFCTKKEWKLPELGGAFFYNEITVVDDKIEVKPIIYVKRIFYNIYKPFDYSNDNNLDTLIHEICHLVKSYRNIVMEQGKIIDYSGLMKDVYSYSPINGIVEESDYAVGIEEAINVVDSAKILELLTGKHQKMRGYKVAGKCANELLKINDIASVIRESQFNGNDYWEEYVGKNNSKKLIESFDILVNAMYVSYSEINTKEKKEKIRQKMRLAYKDIDCFIKKHINNSDPE